MGVDSVAGGMAPWIESSYFKTPLFEKVSFSPSNVTAINTPDPQAVLLLLSFSSLSSGGTPIIWPSNTVSTSTGVVLNTNYPYLIVDIATFGPLCTMQWYGTVWAGAGASISCVTLALNSWPTNSKGNAPVSSNRGIQQAINSLSAYMKQLAADQRRMNDAINAIATK